MPARRDRALGRASDNIKKQAYHQITIVLKKDYGMAQGEARRARAGSWRRGS